MSATIRTFDGAMDTGIVRYTNPFSVNPAWANSIMTSEQALNHPAQLIEIDNQVAVFFVLNTNGSPTYCVIDYPDLKDGKSNTWADIASNPPFYETADLLRTIHITSM